MGSRSIGKHSAARTFDLGNMLKPKLEPVKLSTDLHLEIGPKQPAVTGDQALLLVTGRP